MERKLIAAVLALALAATLSRAEIASYKLARTAQPPTMDGALDDACWKTATRVTSFGLLGRGKKGKADVPPTTALLTTDGTSLYVGVRCGEPLSDKLIVYATEHDGKTWNDDAVEMFFNPSGDRQRYVQFAINTRAVIMDSYYARARARGDLSYESGALAKTRIGKGEWTLEVRIPLAALPQIGESETWTFHIARHRAAGKQLITSLTSPATGFHTIGVFDRLTGVKLPERVVTVRGVSLGDLYRGVNLCKLNLESRAGRPVKAEISAGVTGAEATRTLTLAPGASQAVALPWTLKPDDSGKRITLKVRADGKDVLIQSVIVKKVPDLFGAFARNAYYLSTHRFVRLDLPVRLAEGSRKDLRLRWQAMTADGERAGDGLTSLPDPRAVIRLYWPKWRGDLYTLRLELVRGNAVLGAAERRVRLVEDPWGDD